jgi:DNA-binding NarL/FixJ family response regulator
LISVATINGGEAAAIADRDDGLVGRGDALDALDAALGRAREGLPTVVLVVGEAGMGKTRVLQAAFDREDVQTITAAGDPGESDLDYGVIDQLLRRSPLGGEAIGELLPSPGSDPLEAGAGLLRMFDGLQLGRPLVVVIDDVHWADRASLDALTFTARRLRADRVVCCLACRPEGVDRLPRGLLRLVESTGGRTDLAGLDGPAVRELATRLVGQPVSAVGAERLREHTGGNPLHIRTLLRELPAEALDGAGPGAGPLPAPRSYATLVLARLASCGDDAQRLVAALAVVGARAPLATIAAVAGLDDPLTALDEAVAERLVDLVDRPGERSVTFTHPLVRAAVVGDLAPSRRAALHRAAGEVVAGAAGLRHRLAGCAGYDAGLAGEAQRVAAGEADRGAHASSARLWMEVARVAPRPESRDAAVLTAIDQLLLAGDLAGAKARRHAVEQAPDCARRSFLRGRLAYVLGPRRDAAALLEEAWTQATAGAGALPGADPARYEPDAPQEHGPQERRAGTDDPALAGRIAALLATVAVDRVDGDRALLWARRALALDRSAAADCNPGHMLAMASALQNRVGDGIAELSRALDDPPAHPAAVSDLHLGRGVLRMWAHDLRGGAGDLGVCLGAWGAGGSLVARETARFFLAELHYRSGRWDDAVVTAETAASIVDETDQVWLAAFSHAVAVFPLAARGEWERAEAHLAASSDAAKESRGGAAALWTVLAAIRLADSRGDPAGVVEAAAALNMPHRPATDEGIAGWRADHVEALVATDRVDQAVSVAGWLADDSRGSSSPFVRAEAARARVAVAAATGDDAAVDAAAEEGLAGDSEAPGPYARARLELAVGRAWRRRASGDNEGSEGIRGSEGNGGRAEPVLEAARSRFARLGAAPWVARTEHELAPGSHRSAPSVEPAATPLTAQEQAVTHLVVQGRTNREAAAELFLSVKTVEHHLSRAYAKLGVRSRTELVGRLTPTGDDSP